jgi:hypothetical protein
MGIIEANNGITKANINLELFLYNLTSLFIVDISFKR